MEKKSFQNFLCLCMFMYCAFFSVSAAAIPTDLQKANITVVSGKVFYFGYKDLGKNLGFRCYAYSPELTLLDSFSMELGTGKADMYHEIGFDTLHGVINFWFQQKNNETRAKYLRISRRLKQIFYKEDAELNRVNTQFIYDEDKIYAGNRVYVIRSPRDSAHKFFLSAYELKSNTSFFDYEIKWGFRFYKFNYLRCKLLMADNEKVLVYVHALDGDKKGQYILSISATTGELLKTAEFNDENEVQQYTYFYSAFTYESGTKEFLASGISTKAGEETSLLTLKKPPVLFMIVLNNEGEVKYRFNDVATLPATAMKYKDMKYLCVRVKNIHVSENGLVELISEVCASSDGKKFKPYGYWLVSFTYTAGTKTLILNEYFDLISQPSNKLVTKQAADINGMVLIKNHLENDKTMYMENLNDVMIGAKANGKSVLMLARRKDLVSKKVTYSQLVWKDGKLDMKKLYEATMEEMPLCVPVDRTKAIVFSKSKEKGLIFQPVEW